MKLSDKKILIVDDDPELKALLKKVLENVGCKSHEADGVKESLIKIKNETPDLIILDLNMPGLDGFAFLNFRKQNKFLSSIPVIVLTVDTKRKTMEKAMSLGANHFLEKPFSSSILLQKLRKIFLSSEKFRYVIPPENREIAIANLKVEVVARGSDFLQIESPVRFRVFSPSILMIDDLKNTEAKSFVCKVENELTDIRNGSYSQIFSLIGLTEKQKDTFLKWKPLAPPSKS